jgi:hypothetical protein
MTAIRPGNPVLVVFREVLPGDLRKFDAESNDADTGGGARDLRFREGARMSPILARMFPNQANADGVTRGSVFWVTAQNVVGSGDIEFWPPTDARPNEVRLGRIYVVDGWRVDEAEYGEARQRGDMWFNLLVLDDAGRTWGRILRGANLDRETPAFRDCVRRRIAERRGQAAVFGSVNFISGEEVP